MKPEFSFIIPYFNKWELTHLCLADFMRYLRGENFEVVLVNDASTNPECDGGIQWWLSVSARGFPIIYHKNEINGGFGKSMNIGADLANGDILILYSNDVRMFGNPLPELRGLFMRDNRILVGNDVIYYPGGWNEFIVDGKRVIIPYANGWFLSCTKEVWKSIGGFDHETFGRFDYEDVDLSTRALKLGYNVVALNSPKVVHAHPGSTISTVTQDRTANTQKNREKFIKKWGNELQSIHIMLEERMRNHTIAEREYDTHKQTGYFERRAGRED